MRTVNRKAEAEEHRALGDRRLEVSNILLQSSGSLDNQGDCPLNVGTASASLTDPKCDMASCVSPIADRAYLTRDESDIMPCDRTPLSDPAKMLV